MRKPPLLYSRPPGQEFTAAVVVPVVFGVVTGLVLGASEPLYLLLSLAGIGGGFFAGMEHDVPLEGLYRGLLGGLLFGSAILVAHGLADAEPKAELPEPETLLIVITAVLGAILGLLGARSRARAAD
jgi:hypothetical protein